MLFVTENLYVSMYNMCAVHRPNQPYNVLFKIVKELQIRKQNASTNSTNLYCLVV